VTTCPPEGLRYLPEFVSESEEAALWPQLRALPFVEIHMNGVVARRTVVHYGWDYGYESWQVTPAPPLPPFLAPLRRRAAALIAVAPEALAEVLVSRYPPGAPIGWHRDAPMFGPEVIGVSFGAPCRMRFQRGRGEARETWKLELAPRSAYVLAGAARREWQHCISPVKAERISISFRTLKARASSRSA
jgi:DNA oxidative demethylase